MHVFAGEEEIVCTPGHPFYLPEEGWVIAGELRVGDVLVTLDGSALIIERIYREQLETPETTYNFEVEGFHTYYVGNRELLVHNKCEGQASELELDDDALRSFGDKGKNSGFRVTKGSHDEAMDFVRTQTSELTEYAPGKYDGKNSRGVEFRVYPKPLDNYTSIRINGVSHLKGIKFEWS